MSHARPPHVHGPYTVQARAHFVSTSRHLTAQPGLASAVEHRRRSLLLSIYDRVFATQPGLAYASPSGSHARCLCRSAVVAKLRGSPLGLSET